MRTDQPCHSAAADAVAGCHALKCSVLIQTRETHTLLADLTNPPNPATHWSLRWWLDAMPAASLRSGSMAQYIAHSAVGNRPCSSRHRSVVPCTCPAAAALADAPCTWPVAGTPVRHVVCAGMPKNSNFWPPLQG